MAPENKFNFTHVTLIVSNFNNHVVSWGTNGFDIRNQSIHSEETAWDRFVTLVNANRIPRRWLKKGVQLINMALTKTFKLRMSRPCMRCSFLIEKYAHIITNVTWTDTNGQCCFSTANTIVQGSKWSSGDAARAYFVN
jgi:hypothetical protein